MGGASDAPLLADSLNDRGVGEAVFTRNVAAKYLWQIRGKAGELGRRRKGTVDFWKFGLCPTTFFTFTFFLLASASSGNNQLSFTRPVELCAEQA